jgi:hypothetical protein
VAQRGSCVAPALLLDVSGPKGQPPPDGSAVELRVRFIKTLTLTRDGIVTSDQETAAGDEARDT